MKKLTPVDKAIAKSSAKANAKAIKEQKKQTKLKKKAAIKATTEKATKAAKEHAAAVKWANEIAAKEHAAAVKWANKIVAAKKARTEGIFCPILTQKWGGIRVMVRPKETESYIRRRNEYTRKILLGNVEKFEKIAAGRERKEKLADRIRRGENVFTEEIMEDVKRLKGKFDRIRMPPPRCVK